MIENYTPFISDHFRIRPSLQNRQPMSPASSEHSSADRQMTAAPLHRSRASSDYCSSSVASPPPTKRQLRKAHKFHAHLRRLRDASRKTTTATLRRKRKRHRKGPLPLDMQHLPRTCNRMPHLRRKPIFPIPPQRRLLPTTMHPLDRLR